MDFIYICIYIILLTQMMHQMVYKFHHLNMDDLHKYWHDIDVYYALEQDCPSM